MDDSTSPDKDPKMNSNEDKSKKLKRKKSKKKSGLNALHKSLSNEGASSESKKETTEQKETSEKQPTENKEPTEKTESALTSSSEKKEEKQSVAEKPKPDESSKPVNTTNGLEDKKQLFEKKVTIKADAKNSVKREITKKDSYINAHSKNVSQDRICEFIRNRRAAQLWIEEVLDIHGDLKEDLEESLRNGVILCYLVNAIESRSVPRIQEQTEQAFKLKENITFFLAACKDFGIPPHKLFHPTDLWDSKSIVNVVECIIALAKVAAEKGFKIPLTPIKQEGEYTNEAIMKRVSKEEEKKLKDQLSKLKEPPSNKTRPKISEQIVRRKLAFLAGNGVDLNKYEKGFTRFQAVWRGHKGRKLYQKKLRDQAYRDAVAHEILTTEQEYVKSLGICINSYYRPLKELNAKKKLLDESSLTKIFSDIEIIHSVNQNLLEKLEPIVKNWNPNQCLGEIFLKIMDFLKIYNGYVQNFNTAIDTLSKATKKSKALQKFLTECKDSLQSKLDLPSFLIMPVQRVPRYYLLLKELVKHTWEDHPDYQALNKAVEKISDIASYLNEKKREAENMAKLYDLLHVLTGKKSLKFNLVERTRYVIKEGTFHCHKHGTVMLYLFNDMFLCGKLDLLKKKSKIIEHSLLVDIEVKEDSSDDCAFEIYKPNNKKPTIVLVAKTSAERAQWLKEFQNLTDKVKNKDSSKSESRPASVIIETPSQPGETKTAEQKLRERRLNTLRARNSVEHSGSDSEKDTNNLKDSQESKDDKPKENDESKGKLTKSDEQKEEKKKRLTIKLSIFKKKHEENE